MIRQWQQTAVSGAYQTSNTAAVDSCEQCQDLLWGENSFFENCNLDERHLRCFSGS